MRGSRMAYPLRDVLKNPVADGPAVQESIVCHGAALTTRVGGTTSVSEERVSGTAA